ncbi:Oidioi.mRNA.OKI2018_I69.PAR.g11873.t1.cds [Oikopleura dioica]|uniref:Oidioi.mRNA.OKI2018_I69.PAR.g11873.t1.cds n=1 Tax=Oikopleura dioica TaxID=34765 RepID=A0ABN7S202_OIKDI|nr:Oidioi.mRNA.OKI2018_I69.PAR.g11873.t1.cds [Oikopleura dioica]
MKIGVIEDFFAKKDVKVRQELAKEKELRAAIESDYATFKDRETFLNNELAEFKKTRADLTKRHEIASRERSQTINKVEREAHETWLKWRETDRKVKDLERESKSLQDQLARKAELKTSLEREIHEIHVRQERKAAKRHQEIMEMRARQERDRMLHRMRGPEGEEARRTGRVMNGPRPRGPAPLVQRPPAPNLSHAQRQQQLLYHDSPQLSPIHGNAGLNQPRPSLQQKQMPMAPMPPQMPGAPPVQFPPHSGAPPNSYPQYIAPQPPVMSQAPPAFRQSSPLQENGHPQHNERNYMA